MIPPQRYWHQYPVFYSKILLLAVLLISTSCSISNKSKVESYPTDRRVDSLFTDFTVAGSPGAAAMVIRNGEIIHARGYGLADLDTQLPLSPSTPVRLASVGKAFTAMAIMILTERGELSYDAPVINWVPELARFEGITLRHLLNHTSGLPDYYEDDILKELDPDVNGDTVLSNVDAVSVFETWGDPLFEPGARYEYSNSGYEVLALVVERASGVSFADFLEENIFRPLGMSNAYVRDRPETVIPDRAIGYYHDVDQGGWQKNDDHWGNSLVGAGGIYASLEDFYLWDQFLYVGGPVSKNTLDEAHSSATLNDGSISAYGFGWGLSDRMGRSAIHHSGGWLGFRTRIVRFPTEKLTVVVLSNASANAGELCDEVIRLFLSDES